MDCLRFWADYDILIYTHCQELMKSLGSHGSLSASHCYSYEDDVEKAVWGSTLGGSTWPALLT
jgi:hypothetical protein